MMGRGRTKRGAVCSCNQLQKRGSRLYFLMQEQEELLYGRGFVVTQGEKNLFLFLFVAHPISNQLPAAAVAWPAKLPPTQSLEGRTTQRKDGNLGDSKLN